jgi:hypothetical protein
MPCRVIFKSHPKYLSYKHRWSFNLKVFSKAQNFIFKAISFSYQLA